MKMSAEEYGRRVRRVGPPSPLGRDCLWAFGVGGGICLLGEVLRGWYLGMGLEAQLAGTLTSCTLIVLSALLTTLGLYQKLAAKAGAGSLCPSRALPMPWSAPPSSSSPRAGSAAPEPRCSPLQGRSSCTALWPLWSTVGCSGCWAADRSVYNTPAGMQKLQSSGRADGAEYRTSAIIAQIPKKNSPERGTFSWRPAGVTT